MVTAEQARNFIIRTSVKSIKNLGYKDVNEENIFTEANFKILFVGILENEQAESDTIKLVVKELLEELA